MLHRLSTVLVALFVVSLSQLAAAKSQMDSPYTYRQTFGSALRLAKVDLRFEITEVNAEWGYLLFEYVSAESGNRKNHASIQFVASESTGIVKVTLQVPQMPSYHEDLLLEKLKLKLEEEHGSPPERPKNKDKDDGKKKDGDKDKDKDKKEGEPEDADKRGRNPDNVHIIEPERDSLKKKKN
jgi:hypothetical protein